MRTAFIPKPDGGVFVRWMYAESEVSVRRSVGSIPEAAWEASPHQIEVDQEGLLVFDAACSGDSLPQSCDAWTDATWIHVDVLPGSYLVDTADYEPDDSTQLILHRLRRRCE